MGPYEEPQTFQDFSINVPANTPQDIINQILQNIPQLGQALGGIFSWLKPQQPPPPQQQPDLTPLYLLGGLTLIILLTRK